MWINCYICNLIIRKDKCINIFTSKTIETQIPIYKLLENLMGIILEGIGDEMACEECIFKLNQYDEALCTVKRIKKEFYELLNRDENENTDINSDKIYLDKEASTVYLEDDNDDNIELINREENIVTSFKEYDENSLVSTAENIEYVDVDYKMDEFDEYVIEEINDENDKSTDDIKIINNNVTKEKSSEENVEENTCLQLKMKKNSCEDCFIDFRNNKDLNKHLKDVHKIIKKYKCYLCNASYSSQSALRIHNRIHSDKNPFKCEICDKKFTQKSALKRHQPIHTGEKPYQCHKCGKQFIHYSSFHMHILIHDDVRDKKCEICGLSLRSTSHLKRHMRIHTGEKPFSCPMCEKAFSQRYNMTSHVKSHHMGIHRKRFYTCTKCNSVMPTFYKLTKHLKYCEVKKETSDV